MSNSSTGNPLLDELDTLKGLLAPEPDLPGADDPAIPTLDEVVDPTALPPSRREIEALVDATLDRELNRLRQELRERLIAEVTARLAARQAEGK